MPLARTKPGTPRVEQYKQSAETTIPLGQGQKVGRCLCYSCSHYIGAHLTSCSFICSCFSSVYIILRKQNLSHTWVIMEKYWSILEHLEIGHTGGYSERKALFLAPVLESQMTTAIGSSDLGSAVGLKVTRYFLQREISINCTPWWPNLLIWWKSSPPHSAIPLPWNVARYVPRGDHLQ